MRIELSRRELTDLELIAVGAYAPLTGFLKRDDFVSVLRRGRLADGTPWTIPITLAVDAEQAVHGSAELAWEGEVVGRIDDVEPYTFPREEEAALVYGTSSPAHPGVRQTLTRKGVLLGGRVTLHRRTFEAPTPEEIRAEFRRRGWRTIVAFQTRNPIHRAHEHLLKSALETVDGLLIHPLVGETKEDDLDAAVRWRAYAAVLRYFPARSVVMAPFPASMRYAGPREAVHHAIVRRNYGATHFIVGRDHAGVGGFYGPFEAHRAFDGLELGITPIKFDIAFWCNACEATATTKTCPHDERERLSLSGTQVRELLRAGRPLPREFTRPEVAEALR